jgi:hypothetical protein
VIDTAMAGRLMMPMTIYAGVIFAKTNFIVRYLHR